MTLSIVLILYIVGMVVTFLIMPIIFGVKQGDDLLVGALFFPLFWSAMIFVFLVQSAQAYIDFVEKRNEKNS